MSAPDGIRFSTKDKYTLPLYALMNKAINDYIKAITHICEHEALDRCVDILELHGWSKQRTCHNKHTFDSWGCFCCSCCGSLILNNAVHISEQGERNQPIHYCPNCGAKVVEQ